MIYVIAVATLAMLAYVFWLAAFRMRRERVRSQREQSRGKFAFRAKDRLRFLLGRSFGVAPDKPDWEEPLVAKLAEVPVPANHDRSDTGSGD